MNKKNSDELLEELENEMSDHKEDNNEELLKEELKKEGLYIHNESKSIKLDDENSLYSNNSFNEEEYNKEMHTLMQYEPGYKENYEKNIKEEKLFLDLKKLYDNLFDETKINTLKVLEKCIENLNKKLNNENFKKIKKIYKYLQEKNLFFTKLSEDLTTKMNNEVIDPQKYLKILNHCLKINLRTLKTLQAQNEKKILEDRINIIKYEIKELETFLKEGNNENIENNKEEAENNKKEVENKEIINKLDESKNINKLSEVNKMNSVLSPKKQIENKVIIWDEKKLFSIREKLLNLRKYYYSCVEYFIKFKLKELRNNDITLFKGYITKLDTVLIHLDNNNTYSTEHRDIINQVPKYTNNKFLGETEEEREIRFKNLINKILKEWKEIKDEKLKKKVLWINTNTIDSLKKIQKNILIPFPNVKIENKKVKIKNYNENINPGTLSIKIIGVQCKYDLNIKLNVSYNNKNNISKSTDIINFVPNLNSLSSNEHLCIINLKISNQELTKDFLNGSLKFTVEKNICFFFNFKKEVINGDLKKFLEGGSSYKEDIEFVHDNHNVILRYEASISRGFKWKYNTYNIYTLNIYPPFIVSKNPNAINYNNKKETQTKNNNIAQPSVTNNSIKFKLTSLNWIEDANMLLKSNNIKISFLENNYGYSLKEKMFNDILKLKEKINEGNNIEFKILINKFYRIEIKKIFKICKDIDNGDLDINEHYNKLKSSLELDKTMISILNQNSIKYKEIITFISDRKNLLEEEINEIQKLLNDDE